MIPAFLSENLYIQGNYEVNRFSKRNLGGIVSADGDSFNIYRPLSLTSQEDYRFYNILQYMSTGIKLKCFVFKDYSLI